MVVLTRRQWQQLWYLPVLGLAMALMMLRIAGAARLLDVHAFAQYGTGLLMSTSFTMLGCLGLQSLLQRDMPILLARGRVRASLVLAVQALLVAGGCAAVGLLGASLSSVFSGVPSTLAAAGVLHGLSQQVFVVATVESRSRGEARRYAWLNLVRALLVVASGAAAALLTGSALVVLATEATVSLALVGAILLRTFAQTGWVVATLASLAWRTWGRVAWSTAGVMLAISFVSLALTSIDRWVAVSVLPSAAFAQFTFAGIVLLVAQSLQNMVNASVYPMIARRFALRGTGTAFRLACGVSVASLVATLLLAWPAERVTQAVIRHWFAPYLPAIELLWPLLAASVLRVSDYWSSFLMICNHERHLLYIQLGACTAAGASWMALQASRGSLAPTAQDICWLSFALAAASHIASAASAIALRATASSKRILPHAQPE